jgi:phosphoglycerol transferase
MLPRRFAATGASLFARPRIRETVWALAAGLIALLVAIVSFRLWLADKHSPLGDPNGDGLGNIALAKAVIEHWRYWHIPELGAPHGLDLYDFASVFGDFLHMGFIKIFSIVSQDPVLVFNAYIFAGFPLAAMTAFAVQRDLGVTRPVALVTSVAFSVLPFHFAGIGGTLAAYWAVPLAAWLVIIVVLGRPVWTMHGRIPLPTLKVAIAAFIVSGGSVYWTAFCVVLLVVGTPVVALVRMSWRPLLRGVAVTSVVAVFALVAQTPSLIYHAQHGPNKSVGVRQPFESEIYALDLANIVIPSQFHPVPFLANAGKRYATTTTMPGESLNGFWLGSLGSIGLLLGIGALLRFGLREPRDLPSVGFVSLSALLVSWAGGVSALIAWYVSPQIRAWDRMVVVIAFTSLLSVGLVLDRIGRRLNPRGPRWRRLAFGGGLAILVVLSVVDQTPKGLRSKAFWQTQSATWQSQTHFTAAVVARLPRRGAMVLQLPYVPYPEFGTRGTMIDYEQLRPYVQTSAPVEWSGAAMKGRPTDWGPTIANWTTPELIDRAAAAGFDGIWLDHRAYPDYGAALVGELSKTLGGQTPFTSPDGTISFFDLQPVEREQAARYTREEIRFLGDELVRPLTLVWGAGFQGLEQNATASWHWLGARGTLTVHNPLSVPWNIELRARAYRAIGTAPATVSVVAPAACRRKLSVTATGSLVEIVCRISPGDTNLEFVTSGPEVPVDASQPRPDLRVRLEDPKLITSITRLGS